MKRTLALLMLVAPLIGQEAARNCPIVLDGVSTYYVMGPDGKPGWYPSRFPPYRNGDMAAVMDEKGNWVPAWWSDSKQDWVRDAKDEGKFGAVQDGGVRVPCKAGVAGTCWVVMDRECWTGTGCTQLRVSHKPATVGRACTGGTCRDCLTGDGCTQTKLTMEMQAPGSTQSATPGRKIDAGPSFGSVPLVPEGFSNRIADGQFPPSGTLLLMICDTDKIQSCRWRKL